MPEIAKIKAIAKYNGHNVRNNKSVDLNMLFTYEELPNYIKLIQMLNENVEIMAKIEESKKKLGTFMVHNIHIDHDGQGKIKFNSLMDHVSLEAINELVGETFKVFFKANIEIEEKEPTDD